MKARSTFCFIVSILIAILLVGCKNKNIIRIEIEDTYNNGAIKEEKYYSDSKESPLLVDIEYYKNGDTMDIIHYTYKDNYHDEIKQSYYENGKIESKVTHRKFLYAEKKKWSTTYWSERYKVDTIFFYSENGFISQIQIIKDKCPDTLCCCDGIHLDFKNGKLSHRAYMKNKNTDGWNEYFYPSGKLREKAYLLNCDFDGPDTSWFENGKLSSVGMFHNDKREGTWKYWDAGGTWWTRNYIEGVLNGPTIEYKDTSRTKGQYKDGKETGRWFVYDRDSMLKIEVDYTNGEATGEYIEYYKNGKVRVKGNQIKDEWEGIVYRYDENGKLTETDVYKKGKKIKQTKAL